MGGSPDGGRVRQTSGQRQEIFSGGRVCGTSEGQEFRRLKEKLIRFGTFNIRNSQNGGLELALFYMEQGQVDCGAFRETNPTKVVYAQELGGFFGGGDGGTKRSPRRRQNFYRPAEQFAVEEIHLHGPNVISFQLVTGRRRWHFVGCYISPRDASTIEGFAAAIRA